MQALLQRPNTGRYPELTNHVRDLSKLRDTVDHETAGEAAALRDNDAARDLVIESTARIMGDIAYENITIEQGGQAIGRFTHKGAQPAELKLITSEG